MQDAHVEEAGRGKVYMILRVFDLDGPNTGMRVYIDPEKLRRDGKLRFTGETWSVIPLD